MNLTLLRSFPRETETIGDLFVDGTWFCHTLEDRIRPAGAVKVYGETAIPYGWYGVVLSWSPRFQTILPELLDVPNFIGIRIHPGNTHRDTEGCILVGDGIGPDGGSIIKSRQAFNRLMPLLYEGQASGIVIEVTK